MKRKKRRVDETGSKALKPSRVLLPHNIQPSSLDNNIFKRNELVCQGTYFRDGNKIFIGDGVTLIKRGLDLLVYLKYSDTTGYIARLHKTKEKNVYLLIRHGKTFRIDLNTEITAVIVQIALNNNIVQFVNDLETKKGFLGGNGLEVKKWLP
jgi:hypothetical protein